VEQLAEVMEDLGYAACNSIELLNELLEDVEQVDERVVARVNMNLICK
jgi:hypothetical protein